jgi:hypothetical protein
MLPCTAHGQDAQSLDFNGAQWIWHPNSSLSTTYFRKSFDFDRPVGKIAVLITADDSFELRCNGRVIGSAADWQNPQRYEIARPIARDSSTIAVKAANSGGAAGLLCKIVVRFRDGSEEVLVTDESWQCTDQPDDDWDSPYADTSGWVTPQSLGAYPCQPWGRVLKESWESLRARLIERREIVARASETGTVPQYSTFKGRYVRPEYAQTYRSFVKLNPETGLLEYEGRIVRPFFTICSQPKADGWILNIPEFDFDLLEKDFARMKQAGINIQPRFWSWDELLNYDGAWKKVEKQPKGHGLPYFKYVFQIYDHFLDRAQAHGLYVNIEPSYYWGLHQEVVPPQYRGKILLYDPLWDAARDGYAKILRYFSRRTVIIAAMVGEEDLAFDHCLDEPEMLDQFKRYLRKKYGTISNLHRAWGYGYDYADHSKWMKRTVEGREVLWPEYPFVKGAFEAWKSFDEVRLPIFDYYRSIDSPNAPLADLRTYQENLTRDPCWIDFMEMKEQLLVSRLNDLADALRSADPNHILHYSNAYDFNPAWHFLHCFDRGKLRWDVIGVGQHDSGFEPSEVPQWATCREYVQNVASYGPYLGANGAFPKGFACGEGEGGKTREGTAKYYPWWLVDIVGGGGAFFQSYHWNHISGRTFEKPTEYDSAALDRLRDFLSSVQGIPFHRQSAEVLILRSRHAAYGMSAGYDFGNARYLASILYQFHVPFDILPDSDVTPGTFEAGKVNLNKYRFIFVPAQNQLLSSRTWQMLDDWISDPRYAGRRSLCLGLYQDQDCYFNPTRPSDVHPAFARLTGIGTFSRRIPASGTVSFQFERFLGRAARGDVLSVEFPENGEIGCFEGVSEPVESVLALGEDGPAVVVRNIVNGNSIYTCGFYLGLAYNVMWGMEKEQNLPDVLNPLYMGMLESAGIEPLVDAPNNLGVYIAADDSAILLKERFGRETEVVLGFKSLPGTVFDSTATEFAPDGSARVTGPRIEPYGTLLLRKAAGFIVSGGKGVSSVCRTTPEGGLECEITGKGKIAATFELRPKTIYSVRENGELAMVFTAGPDGTHRMSFNLGAGSKPLKLSVKPSRRP